MNRRARILLADDHALILAGIRGLLEADYDIVGQVRDGRSLVEAACGLGRISRFSTFPCPC